MAGTGISDQYSLKNLLRFVSTVDYPAGRSQDSSPEPGAQAAADLVAQVATERCTERAICALPRASLMDD